MVKYMVEDMKSYHMTYFDEMKYFCLKNCFNQFMEYIGIDDSVLYLKTGFEFRISNVNNNQSFSVFKHDLLMPFFDMNHSLSGQGNDYDKIFSHNLSNLPVIVLVDVFYLPYREEFNKYHASHAIFLIGYEEEQVHIMDWYHPYFYKGTIDIINFKQARSSINPKDVNPFSGFRINNYWYKLDGNVLSIDKEENILRNISNLTDNKEERAGILKGEKALSKIIELSKMELYKEEYEIKRYCSFLHNEIFIWYRAAALSKVFYEKAYNKYPNIITDDFLDFINEGYHHFNDINFYLMKGSLVKPQKYLENSISELELFRGRYMKIR